MRIPEVVAHRGDPIGAPENTVDAIRLAVAQGARFVEVDVRVSADGVPVLLHDERTDRIWGHPARARDLTAEQLRGLTTASSPADGAPGSRIPLLAEALRAAAPARLLVDLPDDDAARACVDVVRDAVDAGAPEPAWCGRVSSLLIVREFLPEAEIWLSRDERELPDAALLSRLRPRIWNPEHVHVDAASVAAARRAGLETSCWTVDDEDRARELALLGVTAIISNRAGAVREALARPGAMRTTTTMPDPTHPLEEETR